MRNPKLSSIFEIDEKLTEILKVKGKAKFPKKNDENMNRTSGVSK